jgi:hypothetical protein
MLVPVIGAFVFAFVPLVAVVEGWFAEAPGAWPGNLAVDGKVGGKVGAVVLFA